MAYRDDLEAAQARIASLEQELAEAQRKVDELEGRRSQALVLAGQRGLVPAGGKPTAATTWLGAPTRLGFAKTFPGEISKEHFPEILEAIQRLTEGTPGSVSVMDGYLTWTSTQRNTMLNLSVTARAGQTTVRLDQNLGALVGGIYGGVGGGIGGGAIVGPVTLCTLVPIATPFILLGWLGGVYGLCRWIYKKQAEKQARKLQALFDEITAIVERKLT